MSNSTNLDINWTIIIGWTEVLDDLGKLELIDLSTANHYLRQKIKPIIFKSLNLERYDPLYEETNKFLFELSNKSIINQQVQKLKVKLQPIIPFMEELSVGQYFNHALTLSITTLVPNLKLLNLYHVRIPIDSLSQLLGEFVALEGLTLQNLSVIQWLEPNTSAIQLKFPKSIKYLFINYFLQLKIPFDNDLISVHFNSQKVFANASWFQIPSQYLPNLETLMYMDTNEACIANLNHLLNGQPQLKSFQTSISQLTQHSFYDLQQCQELNSLKLLYSNVNPYNFIEIVLPTFQSVHILECFFRQTPDYNLVKRLCMICPNVKQLSISYSPKFGCQFNTIISTLTLLKNLVIENWYNPKTFLETELPPSSLMSITLVAFDPLAVDLNKFQNCHKLKHVVIKLDGKSLETDNQYILHFNQYEEWQCLVHQKSIQCFRN